MKNPILLVALPLSCAVALAQTQTQTSPKGYGSVEGNGSHGYVIAATDGLRYQQVDSTWRGTPVANLASLAFRRDGALATNTTYASRTLNQVSVVLSHATMSALSGNFAANYKGAATTVFTPKNVNAPDWSTKPATAPAPFDLKLTFDQQWSYNGTDDLLWEIQIGSVSTLAGPVTNYPLDYQSATGAYETVAYGAAIGTGCLAKGQTTRRFVLGTTVHDRAGSFGLRASANFGPPSTAFVAFLDVSDPNQTVPGLCAVVHALPTVMIPLGTSSSTGSVGSTRVDNIPFVAAAIGGSVYMQAFGLDNSQSTIQIAASQGERLTIPAVPSLPNVGRIYAYSTFGASPVQGPIPGGVIASFSY